MDNGSLPTRFVRPWTYGASTSYYRAIPDMPSGEAGAASIQQGFPPETFSDVSAGGSYPFGQDFNGVLRQITNNLVRFGAGATFRYDATFANAIGGYPKGAVLQSATTGQLWISLADNNTTNPDASNAQNWSDLLQPEINARVAAVAAEASARNNADTYLDGRITSEANTRNTNDTNILNFAAVQGTRIYRTSMVGNWSFTFPPGTQAFLCVIVGAGGPGMGCQASIGVVHGAGASAGETLELGLQLGNGGLTVSGVIGAGATGTLGATTGAPGGNTTLVCNGTTYTARGGIAPVLSNAGGAYYAGGGIMGAGSGISGGDGGDGQAGPSCWKSGEGGAPYRGGSRRSAACNSNSPKVAAAIVPGGGGAGAYDPYGTSTQYSGGDGGPGEIALFF